MWNRLVNRHKVLLMSLLIFGSCGLISVLLDFDHFIPSAKTGSVWDWRPLHRPVAVLCVYVLGIVISHIGRQVCRLILKDK